MEGLPSEQPPEEYTRFLEAGRKIFSLSPEEVEEVQRQVNEEAERLKLESKTKRGKKK